MSAADQLQMQTGVAKLHKRGCPSWIIPNGHISNIRQVTCLSFALRLVSNNFGIRN